MSTTFRSRLQGAVDNHRPRLFVSSFCQSQLCQVIYNRFKYACFEPASLFFEKLGRSCSKSYGINRQASPERLIHRSPSKSKFAGALGFLRASVYHEKLQLPGNDALYQLQTVLIPNSLEPYLYALMVFQEFLFHLNKLESLHSVGN